MKHSMSSVAIRQLPPDTQPNEKHTLEQNVVENNRRLGAMPPAPFVAPKLP